MSDVAGYWKRQFEKVSPRSEPPMPPPKRGGYAQPIVPRYDGREVSYEWTSHPPVGIRPQTNPDGTALARIDARLAKQAEDRFYGEPHNTRNLSELDALLERHRGRHKPDCAREMLRGDIGLPPMPDAFYAFWLGKEGCL